MLARTLLVLAFATLLAVSSAGAQELKIGMGSEATTMDPHFYNLTPNVEVNDHIFDYLVGTDRAMAIIPDLAVSWTALDATTWEFKLRPGVKFQDGAPFTAADVIFSYERAPQVPNSPASYSQFLRRIAEMKAIDPLTLRLKTDRPYPLLLDDLSNVAIISRKVGTGAATPDYNSGKATVGTGPYRLVEWVQGDRLVLERNDSYWGPAPAWKRVVMKPIKSPSTRTAALLAGDVDAINFVPSADVARLEKTPAVSLAREVGTRLFYFFQDVNRDVSPFVTDKAGQPMTKNPLKDPRVRHAISKAVDRKALVERVMDGVGVEAGQFMPDGSLGASPKLKPEPYDPDGAKRLLAEAGYPDGFGLTLHGPNDRYLNDARIVQTVAQMLTRIGIAAKVETLPASVFFGKASNLEFSFAMVGSSSSSGGETTSHVTYILSTFDAAKGLGSGNRGRFSDARVDALVERLMGELDDGKRGQLLIEAADIGIGEQQAIIPMFFEVNLWALRKGIAYTPRRDGNTRAMDFRPAG